MITAGARLFNVKIAVEFISVSVEIYVLSERYSGVGISYRRVLVLRMLSVRNVSRETLAILETDSMIS